ncbi:MAG: hypothetical protein GY943_04395, partial [Chloroflexi bacterium]|nr:hypothetical protein [Chloroflexota bacterium]
MSFDWQTEDDVNWDEPERPSPSSPPRPRRWPWVVVVLLLLGTAVYGLYRELSQRVDVATAAVEADLLASYDVVQQAIRQQDMDLLSTFMSGRDPDWVQLVDQAVRHDGGYYDRSLLAMGWVPTNTAPIPTI